MGAALALSARGRGLSTPNPNVGCVIVQDGRVVGRGWTQSGGRPHAEAMALDQAGPAAAGATLYVTLEPCAHRSVRGPACADLIVAARLGHVVIALQDPDVRTAGAGMERLRSAGIDVMLGIGDADARREMAGFLTRQRLGRPHITLKLATSLDGKIALPDGRSRWITGDAARAHAHLERAMADAILVGRGTYEADRPQLDVRLPGLETRSPRRILLSTSSTVDGWEVIASPEDVRSLAVDRLLVEGGAGAAAAFLQADLVDRLLLYRAPILVGAGLPAVGDIGLDDLATAHGRWQLLDRRALGSDTLEVYERA
jgi:diaminohydroxyphosphoribosylaminopyrimidine deaminase / 5-amino-6-(5-phosphoribosylamino)uracil reductase